MNNDMFAPKEIAEYIVYSKLGRGNFGVVFEVKSKHNGGHFALKIEVLGKQRKRNSFDTEIKAYKNLAGCDQIGQIIDYGIHKNQRFLVFPLYRSSLYDLMKHNSVFFTHKTIVTIAKKMLKALEFVHERNMIYRDLKPENIMLGFDNKLYLVDFGMAKYYRNIDGTHIRQATNKKLSGTVLYASINTHAGIEQSRRDDIEAFGYLVVYLFNGKLPWSSIYKASHEKRQQLIGEMKKNMPLEELCHNVPGHIFLIKFFEHARNLDFEERPNYSYLSWLLEKLMKFKDDEYKEYFKKKEKPNFRFYYPTSTFWDMVISLFRKCKESYI